MSDALLGGLFVGTVMLLGLFLVLFLLLRTVALWYWRINDIVMRLDRIAAAVERANASTPMHTTTSAAKLANGTASPAVPTQEASRVRQEA